MLFKVFLGLLECSSSLSRLVFVAVSREKYYAYSI